MARYGRRLGSMLLLFILGTFWSCCWHLMSEGFVSGVPMRPQAATHTFQAFAAQTRRGATAAVAPEPVPTSPAISAAKGPENTEEIDDAVLQMAMAMADEEQGAAKPVETKKDEGWLRNFIRDFDFNLAIQYFFGALAIYSFGSSFIAIAFGRIQDRSGGDFTLYDFFDNIFAFKEWSLEYTLGFDPFKVWADFTSKKA